MIRRLLLVIFLIAGCSDDEPRVLGERVTNSSGSLAPTILTTVVTAPTSPEGAVLAPVEAGEPRPVPVDDPCRTVIDAGVVQCGVVEAGPGTMLWSLDTPRPDHPGFTATVWRFGTDGLTPVLRAQDPSGQRWVAAIADQVDLDTDGVDEIVFAFREAGSAGYVQLDVVDAATGRVELHRAIDGGRLSVTHAGIVFWEASRVAGDPVCCPAVYDEWIIETAPGPLTEALVAAVSPDEVPAGDLAAP